MSNINEKNQGPRWYVAHTYTGYENKVKDSIEKIVENRGLGHLIYDVRVPVKIKQVLDENGKPVLDKNGDEKIVEVKPYPSYVFVKMTMNDESWHVVRNITGVTGFVGPGSEPTPLTDEEVNKTFKLEEVASEEIGDEIKFNIGDNVKIVSGPFEGYAGSIESIDAENKSMNVLVSRIVGDMHFIVDFKDVLLVD